MNQTDLIAPGAELAATQDPNTSTDASAQLQGGTQPIPEFADDSAIFAALEAAERGEVYEPTPVANQSPEPATIPPAVEQTPAELPEPEKAPQRISVRALPAEQQRQLAQAVDLVRNGQAEDITAAIMKIAGDEFAPEAVAPVIQNASTEAGPAVPEEVANITTRINELCDERLQAKRNFNVDIEDALTREIETTRFELLRAEQSAAVRKAEAKNYQQSYDSAIDELETRHPQAADETSPLYQLLSDRLEAAKARRDPALADPRFILKMADDVAALLGTTRTPAAPAQAPRTTPQPAPVRASRPVGSALAPAQAPAQRMTEEDISRLIQSMPIEDAAKLIFTH